MYFKKGNRSWNPQPQSKQHCDPKVEATSWETQLHLCMCACTYIFSIRLSSSAQLCTKTTIEKHGLLYISLLVWKLSEWMLFISVKHIFILLSFFSETHSDWNCSVRQQHWTSGPHQYGETLWLVPVPGLLLADCDKLFKYFSFSCHYESGCSD